MYSTKPWTGLPYLSTILSAPYAAPCAAYAAAPRPAACKNLRRVVGLGRLSSLSNFEEPEFVLSLRFFISVSLLMGLEIRPVSQRMVIANMVDQSPPCPRSITSQQRFEYLTMLQYGLNERVAIQTLVVEEDVVIRAVTIEEIGNEGILRFLD